jgi:hypothetical protein
MHHFLDFVSVFLLATTYIVIPYISFVLRHWCWYYIVLFNVIAAFQTKHYLWAAFKAKEDKGDAIVEEEVEKGNCVSNQPDKVQSDNASFSSNHGLDRPSMEAPPQSSSSVFGIVVRQAPNLEPEVKRFIQEMERKGALVTVMRGEAIGGGP